MHDSNARHLHGPWYAVLADRDGFVYQSFGAALTELGEEHDEEMTVCVVRGSALPAEVIDPEHDVPRMPGSYHSADKVFELEPWLVDPDDAGCGAEARFAQAQAMAAGLNAAAEAVSTDATRGPWFAIATDGSGFVLAEDQVVDRVMFIIVGRNTAEPLGGRRIPEQAKAEDVLYELDFVGETDPARFTTCWEQAKAVAAALNAVQAAETVSAR